MRPLIAKIGGVRVYSRAPEGVAYTNIYPVINWRYVKQRSEFSDLFTFDLVNPCEADGTRLAPEGRAEVLIYKSEADYAGDVRWFGGVITKVSDPTEFKGSDWNVRYSVEAQGFLVLLEKELRQPQLANLTWANLIKTLLTRHFTDIIDPDQSGIVNPVAAPPVKIVNGSLLNLLRAMRTLTGYDYLVDPYRKLQVFKAADYQEAFTLTDSPTGGMTVFSSVPVVTREARSVFNLIRQPFRELVGKDEWDGEFFIGTGDPKAGQLPLLRAPESNENAIILEDKFGGSGVDPAVWLETDVNTTQHPDYPLQGYLFLGRGQLQTVGGTGSLGGVALQSQSFYEYKENSYIVQEFQLTNTVGTGYIALFTDGAGLTTGNFKAGLKIVNNQLQALDGTVLLAALGTTTNYLIWVTQTATGFQYDIQGGAFATKQTIRTEVFSHLTDYKVCPVASVSMQGSINSFRYRENERNLVLTVDGKIKTVGMDSNDTDLPDIDAFLNLDESPAVIKFKAASFLAVVATVTSATIFTVQTGQGVNFTPGKRILVGASVVDDFAGKEGFVSSVVGDQITLVAPGISGMAPGNPVLVGTTLPAKDAKIRVQYSYFQENEAVAVDDDSIAKYGVFPLTLPQKDHIREFDAAQLEADANLERFRDGILRISFPSNSLLIPEPSTLKTLPVKLSKRSDPIDRSLTIQSVTITPEGKTDFRYEIEVESADPVRPLEDKIIGRNLIIGQDGTLRFTISATDKEVGDAEDIVIKAVSSLYIKWSNVEGRKWGEFRWKPEAGSFGELDFSKPENAIFTQII